MFRVRLLWDEVGWLRDLERGLRRLEPCIRSRLPDVLGV
jgi:hypothetical protein